MWYDFSMYNVNTWLNPVVQNYEAYFGKTREPVVWDVGSRDGRDGVELARRIYSGHEDWFWQRATVVCVEANPEQADVIERAYPEATVLRVAVSNERGSAPFMVYAGDEGAVGSSSLDLEWKGDSLPGHVITVETDRLEHLIGDDEVDVMKIDVEGRSLEALEGLGDKLRQVKVYHIETEVWTNSYVRVKTFMMNKGFLLVDEAEQYGGMPDLVYVRV